MEVSPVELTATTLVGVLSLPGGTALAVPPIEPVAPYCQRMNRRDWGVNGAMVLPGQDAEVRARPVVVTP